MKKYELLADDTIEVFGVKLFRIRATRAFGEVEKGELGGYVASEESLSQEGNAWVSGEAQVFGNAWVSGEAQVFGNARVSGEARVSGKARVSGEAQVFGNARVSGEARVSGKARVSGEAWVFGEALHEEGLLTPDLLGGGAADWSHPYWAARQDMFTILDQAPGEVAFTRQAMVEGRIDGSVYCEDGCGCLTGTIGIACGLDGDTGGMLTEALEYERGIRSDASRPAERWWIRINRGDKPLPIDTEKWPSDSVYRLSWALRWLDEWVESRCAIAEVLDRLPEPEAV